MPWMECIFGRLSLGTVPKVPDISQVGDEGLASLRGKEAAEMFHPVPVRGQVRLFFKERVPGGIIGRIPVGILGGIPIGVLGRVLGGTRAGGGIIGRGDVR